jgi:hypothetical protein
LAQIDRREEFLARLEVVAEGTQQAAGHHIHATSVRTTSSDACVHRMDRHGGTTRLEDSVDRVSYLCGRSLLDLQSLGKNPHQSHQLEMPACSAGKL